MACGNLFITDYNCLNGARQILCRSQTLQYKHVQIFQITIEIHAHAFMYIHIYITVILII